MKKVALISIVVLGFLSMASADNGWGILGEMWQPSDGAQSYGPGLMFQFDVGDGIMLDMRGSYFNDVSDQDPIELSVTPLEAGLEMAFHPSDKVNFYIGGGVGYYMMDGSYANPGEEVVDFDPEDTWGYYGNAMLEFVIGSNLSSIQAKAATLFVEAVYREVDVDKASVNDGPVYAIQTANLSGPGVNVGVLLRW